MYQQKKKTKQIWKFDDKIWIEVYISNNNIYYSLKTLDTVDHNEEICINVIPIGERGLRFFFYTENQTEEEEREICDMANFLDIDKEILKKELKARGFVKK